MDLILDAPWWLPTSIALLGIVLFVSGNARLDKTLRNAGVGIFLLAVLILLLTLTIDTPKKIARRLSTQLVTDAVTGDWKQFEALLEPDASLRLLGVQSGFNSAAMVTDAARRGAQQVRLHEAHIRSLQVVQTGPLVTTTLDILSEQDEPTAPVLSSSWQFDFEQTSAGWRIRELRALTIGDLNPQQVQHSLPAGRP